MKLKSKTVQQREGKTIYPGDEIEAPDAFAADMIATGDWEAVAPKKPKAE